MEIEVYPKTEALIFDLDGTLADTMPLHLKAWQKTCLDHGFEYPNEMFYQLAGLSSGKIADILIKKVNLQDSIDPVDFASQKENSFLTMHNRISPIIPVVKIVYRYHEKMPMAVGSGGSQRAVLKTLEALDLKKYFDVIVTAEDVENHKPAPDTFLLCARGMDVLPELCQVFEDGDRGIEAARRAGMTVTDITPWYPKHS